MNSISFAGGFALALALPAIAAAESATVPYGDLDFSRPADVAIFTARLDTAAKTVCAEIPSVPLAGARKAACRAAVREQGFAALPAGRRAAMSMPAPAAFALASH